MLTKLMTKLPCHDYFWGFFSPQFFLPGLTSTQWLHTKALDSTCSPESGVLDQPELTPVQQCTNALLYHLCKYVMVPSGHKKFVKMDT